MPEWLKELLDTRTVWEGREFWDEEEQEDFIAIRVIPREELEGRI